jgi:hypothetical protein
MPNAAVPYGFGKRLRLLAPDNYGRLAHRDGWALDQMPSFEDVVCEYKCHRCKRTASKENSVYINPYQVGTNLCVECVLQRANEETTEPREVFSVSWNAMEECD